MIDNEVVFSILNRGENNSEIKSDEDEMLKVFMAEGISLGDSHLKFL